MAYFVFSDCKCDCRVDYACDKKSLAVLKKYVMSWLSKRRKLNLKQTSAIDFAVAQEGDFYVSGEAGMGKPVVLASIRMI